MEEGRGETIGRRVRGNYGDWGREEILGIWVRGNYGDRGQRKLWDRGETN